MFQTFIRPEAGKYIPFIAPEADECPPPHRPKETAMNGTFAAKTRRVRMAIAAAGLALAVTGIGFGTGVQPAAAASFDRRIAGENLIDCVNEYGLAPYVRIQQPFVVARTNERIWWMPYLQRWNPATGWETVMRSANWMPLMANYYNLPPLVFTFDNLRTGYYYRIVHFVQWTSTGEFGSMPSDYYGAKGYCQLL